MIYLITGVPGSGKSLYAVSTLLQKLMKETVQAKDGTRLKRRLCADGVSDLIIPHEVMAPIVEDDKGAQTADGDGLLNWWQWCKPGDVLFVDEVQRYLRPRAMGSKIPQMVKELETHRHKGIDLVFVTQNPMLVDQNVRRLVGRHLHVRRLFGGSRALIYDWDGCQTDTHRTSGSTKTFWSYPKDAYKLYKSSELHTKQHQKIPMWVAFPIVVVALGAFAAPKAYDAMHRSTTGKALTDPVAASSAPALATPQAVIASSPPTVVTPSQGIQPLPIASADIRPVGCISMGSRCSCFDDKGTLLKLTLDACEEGSHRVGYVITSAQAMPPRSTPVPPTSPDGVNARAAAAPGLPASQPVAGKA